jgi:hypothetical protein
VSSLLLIRNIHNHSSFLFFFSSTIHPVAVPIPKPIAKSPQKLRQQQHVHQEVVDVADVHVAVTAKKKNPSPRSSATKKLRRLRKRSLRLPVVLRQNVVQLKEVERESKHQKVKTSHRQARKMKK